jgi:Tfp pilus assembly protein PilF
LARIGAVVFAALAASCVSNSNIRPQDPHPLFHDSLFPAPPERFDRRSIFAIDAPMLHFLVREIVPAVRRRDPRQVLIEALSGKLQIDYDADMTRTAAQTFAAREGNCLSLVLMTSALAKQLGIHVNYQEVLGFDTWSRDAGIAFLNHHVNLILGPRIPRLGLGVERTAQTPMIVDFLPAREVANAVVRPIAEETVVAMYLNNRAAELLVRGDMQRAYWFARAALESNPSYADAANTLGVIYRRVGQLAFAEQAVRFTLRSEPENVPALSNLTQLLKLQGRDGEAQVVAAKLAEIQRHPPFQYYDLGMKALGNGQYAIAEDYFRKELSRRPYDDQSHFGLALAALHLGDTPRARKELKKALKNSTRQERHALYAAKLRHLKSL